MRSVVQWVFRVTAVVALILTIVQPVLGPFAFFRPGDPVDYETIHLAVGGIIYNFAIVLVVLALFTRFRHRLLLFAISLVQYGLLHLQLLLGLESNDDAGLLAYHIPIGVLIFFLALLTVALSFGVSLTSGGDARSSR